MKGYHEQAVPNRFFKQADETKHLAIIYPGGNYTAQMPLLYYPNRILQMAGADVLCVDYQYSTSAVTAMNNAEWEAMFAADIAASLQVGLAQRSYARLTLIGKSLGTLALAHLLDTQPIAKQASLIWLTPLLTRDSVFEAIKRTPHRALFAIGTQDSYYHEERLNELIFLTGGKSVVIENADHSLELRNDIPGSLGAMLRVTKAIEAFVR
jgi:hypothetical protein